MNFKERFWTRALRMILAGCLVAGLIFSGGCPDGGKCAAMQKDKEVCAGVCQKAKDETVRERFWIWGHDVGMYTNDRSNPTVVSFKIPGTSRITPVEGAYYMGVPNMIFVKYMGKPAMPYEQYAIPFRALKKVYWSIVDGGRAVGQGEKEAVLKLAAGMPNITGVFMDDFFMDEEALQKGQDEAGMLSVAQLRKIREELNNVNGRRLDLAVTLYTHQLEPGIMSHIDLCDVVTIWTWKSEDLKDLESNFAKLKQMMPTKRIMLGCYMWDFGNNKPMPVERMERQCEIGLKWLKEDQIEGMIFLATPICDLNLEAVEWTRGWISKVGDDRL